MTEYPIHVAVIDDGINEGYYNISNLYYNIEITSDLKQITRNNYNHFDCSHGAVCAAIINKYSKNIVLSSVKVLDSKTKKGLKGQLIKAIEWCIHNKVVLINLSLGTIDFRDFSDFVKVVNYAVKEGIVIVASCSNKDVYTCPASLRNVIGVKCDRSKSLTEGQFIYNSSPPDGIEITACCYHSLVDYSGHSEFTNTGNSYSTPMITAFAANIMYKQPRLKVFEIKNLLKLYSNREKYIKDTFNSCINTKYNIPIILIYDYIGNNLNKITERINDLFKNDEYNTVSVLSNDYNNRPWDIFILQNYSNNCMGLNLSIINMILKIHSPDIIIIGINTSEMTSSLKKKYFEFQSDIKIIISNKHIDRDSNLVINYDKIIYIINNYFCIDSIDYNTDLNIDVLYKYIINLLE